MSVNSNMKKAYANKIKGYIRSKCVYHLTFYYDFEMEEESTQWDRHGFFMDTYCLHNDSTGKTFI